MTKRQDGMLRWRDLRVWFATSPSGRSVLHRDEGPAIEGDGGNKSWHENDSLVAWEHDGSGRTDDPEGAYVARVPDRPPGEDGRG